MVLLLPAPMEKPSALDPNSPSPDGPIRFRDVDLAQTTLTPSARNATLPTVTPRMLRPTSVSTIAGWLVMMVLVPGPRLTKPLPATASPMRISAIPPLPMLDRTAGPAATVDVELVLMLMVICALPPVPQPLPSSLPSSLFLLLSTLLCKQVDD